ncbi:MAG: hypothetical protein R3F13_21955, partial [Prosthecobacter sp.]
TAPPSRRPGAPRFDPDRFSSSIEMFEFNLPLEVFRGATTSGNVLSLRDLYSACLTREIILCMNSGRQSDIKWLKEEQQRVLDRVYPNGTVNKTLPYSLQKLQAAYWKAAVELDRILDSQQ